MLQLYYYRHDESGSCWESIITPDVECQEPLVEQTTKETCIELARQEWDYTPLSEVLKMFVLFYNDPEAWDMYITGMAGTGKTYSLKEIVEICELLQIHYHICTHTHQACNVLRGYMPKASISTTHAFLKKRPAINQDATHVDHLTYNVKQEATAFVPAILFIDELGTVGEKDLMDLRVLQDPAYEGAPTTKIVWLGDLNQTLPVKDVQAVSPEKPYWVKLKEIKRNSTLHDVLNQLVSFIEGKPAEPLKTSDYFVRGCPDLVKAYQDCAEEDKIILAYTNEQVQNLNFEIADREEPIAGDILYSATVNKTFKFIEKIEPQDIKFVDRYFDSPLTFNSKYRTLEFIIDTRLCTFYRVIDEEGETKIFPVIFGTYNHKRTKENAGAEATAMNSKICSEHKTQNAAQWAKSNWNTPLARKRSEAWRKFLTIDEVVLHMDFNHARTVHKAQGSSYTTVFLDTDNIALARDANYNNYLRLMYTGISRSRSLVITN